MVNYAKIITEQMVYVVETSTGDEVKFFKGDAEFDKAVELCKAGDLADIFKLEVKHVITSFFSNDDSKSVTIKIEDGVGKIVLHDFNNMEVELADVITKKIIKMHEQGFSAKPLINFLGNLYKNPSQTAITELYLFIDACNLPITDDGSFIAYKIVRNDYKDIYTGTMDNSVGVTVQMPRGLVDDVRENTCSRGLHFCSKNYLSAYGSSSSGEDRCLLVKINPADVVSIPSDYNNAKGRTWKYDVVGEISGNEWRQELSTNDYTDMSVVDEGGQEFDDGEYWYAADTDGWDDELSMDEIITIVNDSDYYYSAVRDCWYGGNVSKSLGRVSYGRKHIKDALGLSYDDLDSYQECCKDEMDNY